MSEAGGVPTLPASLNAPASERPKRAVDQGAGAAPTIGRIVHVTYPGGETWPAIVTKVHENGTIACTAFEEAQERRIGTVGHVDADRPKSIYAQTTWAWPPRS